MKLKKALQSIKKNLEKEEKSFLLIKKIYPHLCTLSHQEILSYYEIASLDEVQEHLNYLKALLYEKIENREEKLERLRTCFCVDKYKEPKQLYNSEKAVEKQRIFLLKTKALKLIAYPCPYYCGWHLKSI